MNLEGLYRLEIGWIFIAALRRTQILRILLGDGNAMLFGLYSKTLEAYLSFRRSRH